MASFAQLDETNLVTQVLVVNNDALDSSNEEASGIAFLKSIFGEDTSWKQTSYNSKIRYNYAGIGYTYDSIDNAFIAPAPCEHDELLLNDKKQWECANEAHTKAL
jgi:hypothetical protein